MAGNLYAGLANASVSKRGNYLPHKELGEDSRFKVELKAFLTRPTRKSGDAFIVEFGVLESDNPAATPPCERSWFVGLRHRDVAFSNILQFLCAATGKDSYNDADRAKVAQSAEALMQYITEVSPKDNPLIGRTVYVETRLIKTQAGGNFTQHTWYPDPGIPQVELA